MDILKMLHDAIRGLFFAIDNIVYSLIPNLYKLIIHLANVDLFSGNDTVKALMNRVYILVGVFMLFKLAFSVLNYIVDPAAFSDKSKGFGNLVKRVLIALILLVSIPWIFGKVYEYQGKILESNVLPNLILGTQSNGTEGIESAAKDVQFLMFSPFFTVNYNTGGGTEDNPQGAFEKCKPDADNPMANVLGTADMAKAGANGDINGEGCLRTFAQKMDSNPDVKASGVKIDRIFKSTSGDKRDFASLGGLITWSEDGNYVINYTFIISTLVGGYLVFLLLSFCIDVAGRAIKLLFLQILSPVAIIASIDPTSQGDRLKEWGKECLNTFLSLFLRLAIMYVIIQTVKIITEQIFNPDSLYYGGFTGDKKNGLMNLFVYIFLVLGLFKVAKSLPELIEKATGMKMSGDLNLNPFKALGSSPLVGGIAGGIAGAATGGLATAVTAFATSKNDLGRGIGRSLLSGVGGLATGGLRGGMVGAASKSPRDVLARASQSAGRTARGMQLRSRTTFAQRAGHRARMTVGAPTKAESLRNKIGDYEAVSKFKGEMEGRARDQLAMKSMDWKVNADQREAIRKQYMESQSVINQRDSINAKIENLNKDMLSGGADHTAEIAKLKGELAGLNPSITEDEYRAQMAQFDKNEKDWVEEYVNSNGEMLGSEDSKILGSKQGLIAAGKDVGYNDIDPKDYKEINWDYVKEKADQADAKVNEYKNDPRYNYNDAVQSEQSLKDAGMQGFFSGRKGNGV